MRSSGVHKRPCFNRENPIPINNLVRLRIHQHKIPPQPRISLLPIPQPGMSAQPQRRISIESQRKQLVERHISDRASTPQTHLRFVIVSARPWQPASGQCPFQPSVSSERIPEEGSEFRAPARIQSESPFRKADQPPLHTRSQSNRRAVGKKRRGCRRNSKRISKSAVAVLHPRAPLTPPALNKPHLRTRRSFFHVQSRKGWTPRRKCMRDIPIFIE